MTPEKILLSLLRCAVCEEPVSDAVKNACTPEALERVYVLAQKHDLAHIPGQVLAKLGLPECEALSKMTAATFGAVQRFVQLDYELKRICDTLEQAQIPFVPLKGAVVRKFYPEPWMRTSCDIDILVREEDLERAAQALVKELSYTTDHKKKYHDMWLFSPSGVHLELHFSILETMDNIDRLLSRVWEFATAEKQYRHLFPKKRSFRYSSLRGPTCHELLYEIGLQMSRKICKKLKKPYVSVSFYPVSKYLIDEILILLYNNLKCEFDRKVG